MKMNHTPRDDAASDPARAHARPRGGAPPALRHERHGVGAGCRSGDRRGAARNANANVINPDAIAALKNMGLYLRSLKSFSVRAESTTDEVLESGQKIQFGSTVNLKARLPDRLRMDIKSDVKEREALLRRQDRHPVRTRRASSTTRRFRRRRRFASH